MLLENGPTRLRLERRHTAEHLVEDGAERIDVRLLSRGKPTDLFGREVLRRRLLGDDALYCPRIPQADQLHVHQLDAAVLTNLHIARAQRAVDEAQVVKR